MNLEQLTVALRERLGAKLAPLDGRLREAALTTLCNRVVVLTDGAIEMDAAVITALLRASAEGMTHYEQIELRRTELAREMDHAPDPATRRQLLADHLTGLVGDRVELVRDLAATRRWLDAEALFDRFGVEQSDELDQVELGCRAATALVRDIDRGFVATLNPGEYVGHAIALAERCRQELPRVAALNFMRTLLGLYPSGERMMVLGLDTFRRVIAWAREPRLEAWVRIAALEVAITTLPGEAPEFITEQLRMREARDGAIVRHHAVRLLLDADAPPKEQLRVARFARDDPSEHVRQGLAWLLARLPGRRPAEALAQVVLEDRSPRVSGQALRELGIAAPRGLAASQAALQALTTLFERALENPSNASGVVLTVALQELLRLSADDLPVAPPGRMVEPLAGLLAAGKLDADILERIGATLRTLEVRSTRADDELRASLADEIRHLAEGEAAVVHLLPETTLAAIERALLVAARGDLTVSLDPLGGGRYRLRRGERRRLRAWRLVFELTTPEPDKRSAFAHTRARYDDALVVVPPVTMGEVTPTRVPGERRSIAAIRGWGVFLPLVDDLLVALGRHGERRVVTTLGTIVVRAPRGWFRRNWARLVLVWRYPRYARLRERALAAADPGVRERYAVELRRLGFALTLAHTAGSVGEQKFEVTSPLATRYLGAAALAPPLWVEPLVDSVVRSGGNTAWHLALVVWLAFSVMIARAAWQREQIERARAAIPLTIGGWGSRGKSGTERIKAGLFHALRCDVVVKTTGCEAMFIHARRDSPAREIFIYRPYGKATIWEQKTLVETAQKLKAQVFLWECMALQPQFVEILEREWMRDDLTTLTNAYPDHEDVMGPSGEDVARVIAKFMPRRGRVFTAEQEMLPVLTEAARQIDSEIVSVPDLDAQLLPRDLLERYPYAEHPRNIALVLAMGESLGIDREWALVKMADHVVPDLGVLKTYPSIEHRTRTVTFSNGMSANERAGFLSNWTRLGFDALDADDDPTTVIVAVVNNRADRVPRSRVFAELLTHDVVCDHVVLIGSNLTGMRRFYEEATGRWLQSMEMDYGAEQTELEVQLEALARRLRIVRHRHALRQRIDAMLRAARVAEPAEVLEALVPTDRGVEVADDPEAALGRAQPPTGGEWDAVGTSELVSHVARLLGEYRTARASLAEVRAARARGNFSGVERTIHRWFEGVLLGRVSVVSDLHAKGDQVIDHAVRQVAPGHDARLLGCQNIKGTGLDFAYRWVSIGQVVAVLDRAEQDPYAREDLLRWLGSHGDYGLFDTMLGCRRFEAWLAREDSDWEPYRADLERLRQEFLARLEKKRAALRSTPARTLFSRSLDVVEPLVDHLDSIRRQRQARRIMQDLFALRISQSRAAVLLREITDRSKGGWLAADWEAWRRRRNRQNG